MRSRDINMKVTKHPIYLDVLANVRTSLRWTRLKLHVMLEKIVVELPIVLLDKEVAMDPFIFILF